MVSESQQPTAITIEEAMAQAMALFTSGRHQEVENLCAAILQANPNHLDALILRGEVLLQGGQEAMAVELFGRAVALQEAVPELHHKLGIALHGLGCHQEARQALARALELAPEHDAILGHLGVVEVNLGEQAAGMATLRRCLAVNPDHLESLFNLANLLREQAQVEEALALYGRCIEINPQMVPAHYNRGRAEQMRGDLPAALDCFRQALALDAYFEPARTMTPLCPVKGAGRRVWSGSPPRPAPDLPGCIMWCGRCSAALE